MSKSTAAIMTGIGTDLEIETIEVADPRAGEVLVEIKASGICHSDYNAYIDHGTPVPSILGHEGAGIVKKVGSGVSKVSVGDRVMLSWAPYCGTCPCCDRGDMVLCETMWPPMCDGTMFDGTTRFSREGQAINHYSLLSTFTELTVVQENSCVLLPNDFPFKQAALIGCGVATGYGATLKAGKLKTGDSVVIFGVGGVGSSAVQAARIAGAKTIIGIDINDQNEEQVRKFGAHHFLNPNRDDVTAEVMAITSGKGVDLVIDCSGSPAVLEDALVCARRGGTIAIAGVYPSDSQVAFHAGGFHSSEKKICGTLYGSVDPQVDFKKLVQHYLDGELMLDEMLLSEIGMDQLTESLRSFGHYGRVSCGRELLLF